MGFVMEFPTGLPASTVKGKIGAFTDIIAETLLLNYVLSSDPIVQLGSAPDLGGFHYNYTSAIWEYYQYVIPTGWTKVPFCVDEIYLLDNKKIYIGTGNDLTIYHNGTSSFLTNATGDWTFENTSTAPTGSNGCKIKLKASCVNVNTTGTIYTQCLEASMSEGTSTSAASMYASYEKLSLTTNTNAVVGFPYFCTKCYEVNLTGGGGTTLGSYAYGVVNDVNISGSFLGTYFSYLGAIYNDITLTGITIGAFSAVDYQIGFSGTNSFTSGFYGVRYTLSMGSGNSFASFYGDYKSITSSGSQSAGEGYGNYLYLYSSSGKMSRRYMNGNYVWMNATSESNSFGFRAHIENSILPDFAFCADKGKSILQDIYIGKPYTTGGDTGGDLKDNMVTNSGFSADSDWIKGTGWTITGGKAVKAAGTASDLEQDISVIPGRLYFFQTYITPYTAGTLHVELGGVSYEILSLATGKLFTGFIIPTGTGNLKLKANSTANYSIDYVIVREIGEANVYMGTGKLHFWDLDTYINSDDDGELDLHCDNLGINGELGADGSFKDADGNTITVTKGLITAITPP